MTAPDHATSHSQNILRERGHPYMGFEPKALKAVKAVKFLSPYIFFLNSQHCLDLKSPRGRMTARACAREAI